MTRRVIATPLSFRHVFYAGGNAWHCTVAMAAMTEIDGVKKKEGREMKRRGRK